MARVRKVVLVDAPPGPDKMFADPKVALSARPQAVAVVAVSLHEEAVKDAAYRINADRNPDWPGSRYYAIWNFNSEAAQEVTSRAEDGSLKKVGEETPGRWELLVGTSGHEPEGWREMVADLRKRKKSPYGRAAKRALTRMTEVVLRDGPEIPEAPEGGPATPKQALAMRPDKTVVDAVFATEEQAYNAAYRVNNGERKDWPKDQYYAIYGPNPEASEPDENGISKDAWLLLIGLRSHLPEGWAGFVSIPGSRRGRRRKSAEGDPEGVQEVNDSSEVESESDQNAAPDGGYDGGHYQPEAA